MKVYVKNNYKLVDLKKIHFMNPPIFNLEIQKKVFVQPNENQAQMIGWHGSDSIFMIMYYGFQPKSWYMCLKSKQCI